MELSHPKRESSHEGSSLAKSGVKIARGQFWQSVGCLVEMGSLHFYGHTGGEQRRNFDGCVFAVLLACVVARNGDLSPLWRHFEPLVAMRFLQWRFF